MLAAAPGCSRGDPPETPLTATAASAAERAPRDTTDEGPRSTDQQRKLGLSLRGGGANVGAYLGVLRAFEERGIHVDLLVGASGGAIVGGYYAAGLGVQEIDEAFTSFTPLEYVGLESLTRLELVSAEKAIRYNRRFVGDARIEDSRIPLWIQATNVAKRQPDALDRGPLAEAIVASSAMPGLMDPVSFDDELYLDGDLTSGYAADLLRANGAEVVIGLTTDPRQRPGSDHLGPIDRVLDSLQIATERVRTLDLERAPVDLLIDGLGGGVSVLDTDSGAKLMEQGYAAAKERMPEIERLLFGEPGASAPTSP